MVAQRIFTESHLPRFTKSTPSVDQVVNVDTFYRYLSILEEFCDLKRQLESKGREFADAYIQFSIARYIDFLRSASYKPDEPIPIDIAYVWHAHMLSPYRYYEDITYNIRDCKITVADAFPIYPLSEEYLKATSIPSKPISDLFVNHMTDPTKNTNTVTCRGCKDVLLHTWGESYEWRINPNVALECHNVTCTKRDNTLDDFALQELLNDLPRGIIKGNTLTPNGLVKSDLDDYKAIISGLYTHAGPSIKKAKTINEVTFLLRRSAGILADGTELDDVASDITKIIKSTYENNPSIFSLDLVQAVRRLDNFMDLAISKDDFRTPDGLVRSVRRYNDYLHLRKLKQHQDALPSLDVDIAWHVHMLHPNNYRHTMEAFLGHIPDHDSNIGPSDLDDLLVSTRRGWEKIWRAQILQASAKDGRGIAAALKKTTKLDKLKIPGGNKPATHPENKYNSITNDHDDSLRYVAGMYELPEDLNPSAFDRLAVPVVSYHNWRKHTLARINWAREKREYNVCS
ncbi:hypothetical protein BX666DRAFT_1920187 [Dichotomocladium elegans]|nr:hypothetical protein BX666DRAFT_1920187 [Dichotomocladium elegans]